MARLDLRRDLKLSSFDSFFSNIMTGTGETLLPAFALAMGMSGATVGLFASIPFLIGSCFQLFSRRLACRVGSYRKFCVVAGILQASSFVPLSYFAYNGEVPAFFVFLVATLYWAFGVSATPVWSAWMGALIPSSLRPRYFAFRSRVGQAGLVLAILGGGLLLQHARAEGRELIAFSLLFAVAGAARMISIACLKSQDETPLICARARGESRIGIKELILRAKAGQDGKLFKFLLSFQVAMNFSAPFFTSLLLGHLKLSYVSFIGLVATSFITKAIVYPRIGHLCKALGPIRVLRIGALLTAICPLTYILSPDLTWLFATQILSGVAGSMFDLGSQVATYNSVKEDERTSFISKLNFANAVAMFVGTFLGAQILRLGNETHAAYVGLFLFSTCARFAATALSGSLSSQDSPASAQKIPSAAPVVLHRVERPTEVLAESA